MKKEVFKPSYNLSECLKFSITNEVMEDLKKFYSLIESLSATASKNTHYDKLDEWDKAVYGFIHKMLDKYKFVNASAALGITQPPMADFWFNIYQVQSNICYSNSLKTEVSLHHSSAYERNEALKVDMNYLINNIQISE